MKNNIPFWKHFYFINIPTHLKRASHVVRITRRFIIILPSLIKAHCLFFVALCIPEKLSALRWNESGIIAPFTAKLEHFFVSSKHDPINSNQRVASATVIWIGFIAPKGELLSFAPPKESNQRKGGPVAAYLLCSSLLSRVSRRGFLPLCWRVRHPCRLFSIKAPVLGAANGTLSVPR